MGDGTSIQWTDATWNPVRGCSRVSEGCRHCYAEGVAARFSGPGQPYEGLAKRVGGEPRWTGKVRVVEEHMDDPLRWKKPRRVFVNSMSDLFHEGLTDAEIARVFSVMSMSQQHTFQVLTKRPRRALEWFGMQGDSPCSYIDADPKNLIAVSMAGVAQYEWPLPNVHLGVSVEDQETADERIPLLLQCPAAVRFVSYEPALGPVNFTWLGHDEPDRDGAIDALRGEDWIEVWEDDRGARRRREIVARGPRLDWIIVGGESGHHARPFDIEWARSTVRQCREAGVACFVKQLGAKPTIADGDYRTFGFADHVTYSGTGTGRIGIWLRDSHGGDMDEWPADLRVRQFPATTHDPAAAGAGG